MISFGAWVLLLLFGIAFDDAAAAAAAGVLVVDGVRFD